MSLRGGGGVASDAPRYFKVRQRLPRCSSLSHSFRLSPTLSRSHLSTYLPGFIRPHADSSCWRRCFALSKCLTSPVGRTAQESARALFLSLSLSHTPTPCLTLLPSAPTSSPCHVLFLRSVIAAASLSARTTSEEDKRGGRGRDGGDVAEPGGDQVQRKAVLGQAGRVR
eukprot:1284010-Rhodomonas_salina.1